MNLPSACQQKEKLVHCLSFIDQVSLGVLTASPLRTATPPPPDLDNKYAA